MTRAVVAFLYIAISLIPLSAVAQERITVFAAASLKDAMDRAIPAFKAQSGMDAVVSLAASSVLARQVDAGAPAGIFISADMEWMDWLAERGRIDQKSRRVVAGNNLVIAAKEAGSGEPAALLEDRFAMGDPNHVPAGRYAEAALSSLGLWEKVREHAVFGENVRVALELARRGEVGAAIVYGSDQKAAGDLVRAYIFPKESHPPIVYPAAATSAAPEALAFLDFLTSEAGQAIFEELGFAPAPR